MSWLFKDPVVIMKEIMPWLFKDPIVTVAWINFDHTQSNSKNWPKKINLPQMGFFLEKQLIKFSCTSWPLSLCKFKKKKNLKQIRSYEDAPFLGQNDQIAPNYFFFFFQKNH